MGTLFSALDIAQSGLQAAQIQMDVAGHNIANVNKEGFSRQRVTLTARHPDYRSYGAIGRGVQVVQIERIREIFLDTVFRQQVPGLGSAEVRATYFSRIEDIFQEPGEHGLGSRLNLFFDALNDFANNVEAQPVRLSVLTEAEGLVTTLRQVEERLRQLRTNANEEMRNMVPEINSLAERIAAMNVHIRDVELSTGVNANDMRDERDILLDELASLVNITARERADGQVDVLISGDVLVNGATTRELVAVRNPALDPDRADLVEIHFADTDALVNVRDGQLYGALSIRDAELVELDERIDQIAATIIEHVNRIHALGNGLTNLTGTVTGTNAVTDPTVPLNSAGLPFTVTYGPFDVVVYDADGNPTTTSITVDDTTTLESLVAELNAIDNFSASITVQDTVELTAANDHSFSFSFPGHDEDDPEDFAEALGEATNVLVALGVNGLFTGHDARTIDVNPAILDNPLLLTSAFSLDPLETGDNAAARAMADVRNALTLESNSASLNDYYESTLVKIGIDARANQDLFDVERAFVDDFRRRRQEVSGVSIDEEVTNLMQYQRAFEAAARVIMVTDRMLDALLNMV